MAEYTYLQLRVAEYGQHGTGMVGVCLIKGDVHPSNSGELGKGESVPLPTDHLLPILHLQSLLQLLLLPVQMI